MSIWIAARPQINIPGLIDSGKDECHITLAFLGKQANPGIVKEALETKQFDYQQNVWPDEPIVSEITGTAQWVIPGGKMFQVALVQPSIPKVGSTDIYDLRTRLVNKLAMADIKVNDAFPFIPHITLKAIERDETRPTPLQRIATRYMFLIDKLYVCFTNPAYIADPELWTTDYDPKTPEHVNWQLGQPTP